MGYKNTAKIKEILLGVSIAIIFVFFVVYSIKAVYKEPKSEDFCKNGFFIDTVFTYHSDIPPYQMLEKAKVEKCAKNEMEYNKFRRNCADNNEDSIYVYDENGCIIGKECTSCKSDFSNATNLYFRNVFIASGIIGILVILIGLFLHLPSVSTGLFGGGVLTLIYGTVTYWSELADWARVIILGTALAIMIYMGYKKFSNK